MMEEISTKFLYTKSKLIASSIVTIVILVTLTMATFTALSTVGHVEAITSGNCEAWGNTNPNGDCDVDVEYFGSCNSGDNNCNVRTDVALTPNPLTGDNKLSLDYLLKTGIECGSVKSSWGKANCLTNSQNEYSSDITGNTPAGGITDNDFYFTGSQQVRETSGQDRFIAKNTMDQDVALNTAGTGSTIKTDNVDLKYLQDIVEPDDTTNTNNGRQFVTLRSGSGGIIDTSEHTELGFNLEQKLLDIDNHDTAPTDRLTAKNNALQTLGIDSDNGGLVKYDTNGLSLVSQTIDDCSFATTTTANPTNCLNSAGDPTLSPTLTNGQRAQLFADGAGTTIDVDNLRQLINQNIDNFEYANGDDATNTVKDGQLFVAKATQGGDIDMALSDVDEQTQSLSQSIINSDEPSINEVVKPNAATFTTNTARQTELFNLGFAGSAGQAIYIGEDPRTPLDPTTATTDSVKGLVEADVDQILKQSISENDANTGTARNSGTMVMTLLAKDGLSELFVEGFDQYLTQTATCSNCANNGAVSATFEVNGDSTLTLTPGSIQGLTQTLTRDGATNTNAVISSVTVTGTDATIGLNQQISNTNGGNNGISQFTGTYTAATPDRTQNCNISQNGVFTQASSVCS